MNLESQKIGANFELERSGRPGIIVAHSARWALLFALALLTYLLFPVPGGTDSYELGEIAAAEVIAPFEFSVMKSPDDLERERQIWERTVPPVYEYREDALDSIRLNANALFAALDRATSPAEVVETARRFGIRDRALNPEEADYLLAGNRLTALRRAVNRMIDRQLSRGVPDVAFLMTEASPVILEVHGPARRNVQRDSVHNFERFMQALESVSPDPTSQVGNQLLRAIIQSLFRPTLVPNQTETDSLRREVRNGVNQVRYTVRENERIVDANEVITEEIHARLSALRSEQIARGLAETSMLGTLGKIFTNALVLALLWVLLMLFLPETYSSFRRMGAIALLFGLVIIGAAANVRFLSSAAPELIPIPFAAMLMTVLFGGRLAMVSAMVLAVLLGPQVAYSGTNALFVALVGGVAAALSVRTFRRRNQLLVSVVVVSAAFLLVGLTIALQVESDVMDVLSAAGFTGVLGGLNVLICAALVTITLPIFESMTGITTEFTHLELSDPARPLLRRLATEVPGTYAHSLALANMCEAACNAIGANGLLARVGCYYHDIGKLKKPQFFVENQAPGVNPHDKLKPEVSAAMIRNHVKEGLALAKEQRLPDDVTAFIAEHHGTMEISFFLERARGKNGEAEVEPGDYRYPGPKPRSVETAVAMLADGVEAALRVLTDQSTENVRDAIDHLVRRRIEDGQLDEAPLTMAQLTRVRSEFLRVFEGTRHSRIDYPKETGGLSAGWDANADA